ncbi:hypothetical protein [Streptomyces prasinus]|uniref:hypothetical protein n=1 Tax=Streptomyces prasinus TaxID=67345 RepID=UPI0036B9646B
MTAPTPEAAPAAEPAITRRPVPRWITDPEAIESIARGFYDIDDDFLGGPK